MGTFVPPIATGARVAPGPADVDRAIATARQRLARG
jgi:hypothetical protein